MSPEPGRWSNNNLQGSPGHWHLPQYIEAQADCRSPISIASLDTTWPESYNNPQSPDTIRSHQSPSSALRLHDSSPSPSRKRKRSDHNGRRPAIHDNDLTVTKKTSQDIVQHVFRANADSGKRSRMDDGSRSLTKVTRTHGSCPRCKAQKIRCNASDNPYDPCETCALLGWDRVKQPCSRVDILMLTLNRLGSTITNDLQTWHDKHFTISDHDDSKSSLMHRPSTVKVQVEQVPGVTMDITLARFVPGPDDVTSLPWTDMAGESRILEMPPYYIVDLVEARANIQRYAMKNVAHYLKILLKGANTVTICTFQEACKFYQSQKSELVITTLRFWVTTRMTEVVWNICDGSKIGFNPPQDPMSPWHGVTPVTPVMDTQLDDLALRSVLLPLRKRVLKLLNQKLLQRKKEDFFEIFLATFILLSNFESIFADVIDFTTRHGMTKGSGGPSLCEGYLHACKAILSYFHFACRGSVPLAMDWTRSDRPGFITDTQAEYLRIVQQELESQKDTLSTWREESMYKRQMYWCYQMFVNDWRGDITPACEILPFSEKDFLTT